ncbi:PH domain-containing protein [Kytococcus sedentarius]|uniref:PH domain-containing protein n=1 Tax=Kytococcus sedentarius TaxID=1276 RepID=UPI0035BBD449
MTTPPGNAPQLVAPSGRAEIAVLEEPRHRVSPKAPAYWRLWSWISLAITLVISGTVLGVWWLLADGAPPWWAWSIAGLWLAIDIISLIFAPTIRYRVARWEATPDAMYTRTGWLNIDRRMVPLARIQTVDVSRGPIMRRYGLTDVKVTTASSQGDIEIEALDDVNAQALLEELTRAAAAVRGDGT